MKPEAKEECPNQKMQRTGGEASDIWVVAGAGRPTGYFKNRCLSLRLTYACSRPCFRALPFHRAAEAKRSTPSGESAG